MLPSSLLCRLTTAVAQSRSVPTRLLPVPALTPSCVRALIYRPVHPPPPPFQQTIVPSLQIVALDKLAFDFFEDDDGTYVHPVHVLGTPTQGKRGGGDAYMSSGPHTVSSDVVESIGLCEECMLKMRVVVVGCERTSSAALC